ncbi:MAG: hypothetical protein JWO15_3547 [Sphingomonadales bacterium]|nr:hypothetical protein [Sphingomonadales bacterium]
MHKHLKSAISLANAHQFDERLGYTHCAVIVRGGAILSVGYNGLNINGFVDYLSAFDKTERPFINKHAEVHAILSARNKLDLRGAKLFVARIKPTGIGMSKPCESCRQAARQYGIRRIIFTVDDNEYGVLKV